MSSLMRDRKRALRGAIQAKRDSLSSALVRAWGESVQCSALTLPVYLAAEAVALYSPLGNEVDTSEIGRVALEAGKRLYYPKVTDGCSSVVHVRSEAELVPGRYGILEPAGNKPLPRGGSKGLAVFVPGVAFDPRGNRLGRGTGWYDRLLAGLDARVPRIALAYEFQVLEDVPAERGDLPVHMIVTENRVISCGEAGDCAEVVDA
jgi:5-formyltetrahydrofolate cyclo-ligase